MRSKNVPLAMILSLCLLQAGWKMNATHSARFQIVAPPGADQVSANNCFNG